MGKGGAVTIGFRELMGVHMGFCFGPVDALLEITGDKKTAWLGEQTTSGFIAINKPNLYGGEKKEGGLVGTFELMMGDEAQTPNAYLTQAQGGLQPAYLDLCTGVFRGQVGAITPYIKQIGVRVRRALKGWQDDDCWEPTLAKVDRGMNPAHIIMQCYTDPRFGPVFDRSDIDLDNFLAVAQTLKDEDLGLCLGWRRSTPMASFVGTVFDHIGAMPTEDPETLKQQIVLIRDDYDVDTVVQVDESNIIELVRFQQALLADSVNEVIVKYKDVTTNTMAATAPAQNLANISAQGKTVNETKEYTGFYKGSQANWAAVRDCHAKSSLPASVELKVKSILWRVKKGDVIAFSWKRKGIVKMALRVLEVGRGDRPNSPLTLTCAQDAFSAAQTTYLAVQPTGWVPPDTTPHPITTQRLIEVPYRDLAHRLRTADLQVLAADAGYLGALGVRPAGVTQNFGIVSRIGSNPFTPAGTGDFCPGGLINAAIPAGAAPVVVTLTSATGLDLIAAGKAAFIDDEAFRIDAINPLTAVLTLARGCADTVPAQHALGARLWCYEDHAGYSTAEYTGGETVNTKLLTRTSAGELDQAAAIAVNLTFNDRQIRPYPPGNLKINGVAYPATVTSGLVLTWSHCDRGLQADQLIDTAAANIGPEAGVTYTVRTYLNGVLKSTTTGITGTTHTPANPGSGTVRIEVDAVRAGYTSWQPLTATFGYGAPQITTGMLNFATGVASSIQLAAQYGTPPLSFISGTLPAGITMTAAGLVSYDGTGGDVASTDVTFTVTDAASVSSSKIIPVRVKPAGLSRAWRLRITANNGNTQFVTAVEVQLRAVVGGANLATGGVASATSEANSSNAASYAFNGNLTDKWTSAVVPSVSAPQSLAYILPAEAKINQVALTGCIASQETFAPKDFVVQSSDDATNAATGTWVDEWAVTGQTSWTGGVTRVFTRP